MLTRLQLKNCTKSQHGHQIKLNSRLLNEWQWINGNLSVYQSQVYQIDSVVYHFESHGHTHTHGGPFVCSFKGIENGRFVLKKKKKVCVLCVNNEDYCNVVDFKWAKR